MNYLDLAWARCTWLLTSIKIRMVLGLKLARRRYTVAHKKHALQQQQDLYNIRIMVRKLVMIQEFTHQEYTKHCKRVFLTSSLLTSLTSELSLSDSPSDAEESETKLSSSTSVSTSSANILFAFSIEAGISRLSRQPLRLDGDAKFVKFLRSNSCSQSGTSGTPKWTHTST